MPRTSFSPKNPRKPSTDPQPPEQAGDRPLSGPLAWTLGGAPQPQPRPGPGSSERRREPAPAGRPNPAVDARRRRNPSSRFRG